jgi:formylglycine-generating enzyme required for sulfatase activity
MKQTTLSILLAVAAITSAQAQTLQVDPILERGSATFEIQNGTPGAKSMLLISTQGPGPISLPQLGVDIDLTLPIQNLPMENVDALGFSYNTRSYAVPANVLIGRQIWFQGIQLDIRANPAFTMTNMVPITVTEVYNNPPLAVDDSAGTHESVAATIDVLANDSDPEGDGISLFSVSAPANGIAVINGGVIDYTPNTLFLGVDTFTYQLQDSYGSQDTATVAVTVIANNPPVAVDDNAATNESVLVTINVLANDSDPDGDPLSIVAVAGTGIASLVIVSGQVEYTPQAGYQGTDTFTYTIEDGFAAQATATVYVDVLGGSGPPNHMVAIPGGTFEMGAHALASNADQLPIHSVTLDAFFMDKYEVSNTKFADFLNNSNVSVSGPRVYQVGGTANEICYLLDGLNYSNGTFVIDAGKDNHPAVRLSWHGATLYCNYLSSVNGRTPCYDEFTFDCDFTADGFRLPTEAEWEYASRGGEHNPYYLYPWGSDSITANDANFWNNGPNTTVDVGNYAANGYGLYDMAGNVYEWCNDRYGSYSYLPQTNPTGPASGSYRIYRGGGWGSYSAIYLRCAYRNANYPTSDSSNRGFRVLAVQ